MASARGSSRDAPIHSAEHPRLDPEKLRIFARAYFREAFELGSKKGT